MDKRTFIGAVGAAIAAPAVWAQKAAEKPGAVPAGEPFVVAINEGVTYRGVGTPLSERLADVQNDLQKILKRPVRIQGIDDYVTLAEGLAQSRYDLAWVHPAHHSFRAILRSGYQVVCGTKGWDQYRASFMVRGDSPYKTINDLRDKKIGAPAEDSITSVMLRATLKETLGTAYQIVYVRYQDAVPFMVENNLAACGVSASRAVVRDWTEKKGGRVAHVSRPVPIKHWIASNKVSATTRNDLANYFLSLEGAEADKRLKGLNVAGFMPLDPAIVTPLGTWLGV